MQTQTLPSQLTANAIAPSSNRMPAQPNSDGPAFSQTLNREMAQRQKTPASPQVAIKTPDASALPPKQQVSQAAKPTPPVQQGTRAEKHIANVDNASTGDAPATDAATDAAADAATAADASMATVADPAADAAAASAAAAAEGAAAAAPMTDMLAMVASYKQLMQGGAAKPPAATDDTATAAKAVRGAGIAADTQTLATLQGALQKSDGADTGKTAALARDMTTAQDDAPVKGRAAPDLGAVATLKTPQADVAAATLREAVATATVKDTAPVTGSAFQAQLSAAEMVQTAVTPASDRIPARLGTTAWDNQVSQKVVWMVGGADQTASLTLNPPDLGPVQVVLNVNNDQATVAFHSATPEVREALENAMPRLRDMLSDAGVTLGEASVSANMPDGRQADTGQGSGERGGNRGGANGGAGVRSGETEIAVPRTASRAIRDDGSLDTFA
jgi:flagellar hook-length control protein FliK